MLRLCPPVMVDRRVKFVSEYTRIVLSELHVATSGRLGCGAVNQVRSRAGGVRSERSRKEEIVMLTGEGAFFLEVVLWEEVGWTAQELVDKGLALLDKIG